MTHLLDGETRHSFRSHDNDLYCEINCTCLDPQFADSSGVSLFTRNITLIGYADSYFFDVVNAQPGEWSCECGRRFRFQWFRDGVSVKWIDDR